MVVVVAGRGAAVEEGSTEPAGKESVTGPPGEDGAEDEEEVSSVMVATTRDVIAT